ncbi:LINE-1 type transposase domain-containing protein 1 isoform X2 [Rhinoraja longicauda]
MSLQRSPPPRGGQKKTGKKPQMEEEGPLEASASITTRAQEDPSKRMKKSEMEDFKTFLAAELKTFGEKLDSFRSEFKTEMLSTVQLMLESWKRTREEEVKAQMEVLEARLVLVETKVKTEMDPVHYELGQHQIALTELEKWATSNEGMASRLLTENQRLSDMVIKLNEKCTDLEGRQRRKNLRIVGVKEGGEKEMGTRDFVADLLHKALKLDHKPLLGRAHRVQQKRIQDDAHPRQIIVKVQLDHELDDIMRKMVRGGQLLFEGARFSIYRDYPVEVHKKRVQFIETKRILKKVPDLRYSLLYPARLRVSYKSKVHFFTDHEKAMEYAKEVGNMTD